MNPIVPFVAAGLVAVGGVGYGLHEHNQALQLASSQRTLTSSVTQLEKQVQELSGKVNQPPVERAAPAPEPEMPPPAPIVRKAPLKSKRSALIRTRPVAEPREDPRWQQVESRLTANERGIVSTREEVQKTRVDMESQLGATKTELNGSIARTHEEVVLLQKRGERDYSEFTLAKSKDFRKVGPMSLSLRKADTKHKRYNLEMVVDDVHLEKKNVNIFEPVYLTLSDRPQPVEVVVNHVGKNEVRGYVSQPKYKKSELVSDAAARVKLQPSESPQ
jgi:hypothetical protein